MAVPWMMLGRLAWDLLKEPEPGSLAHRWDQAMAAKQTAVEALELLDAATPRFDPPATNEGT